MCTNDIDSVQMHSQKTKQNTYSLLQPVGCHRELYLNTHTFPSPATSTQPQKQQNTACIISNILYFSGYKTSVQTFLSLTDVLGDTENSVSADRSSMLSVFKCLCYNVFTCRRKDVSHRLREAPGVSCE